MNDKIKKYIKNKNNLLIIVLVGVLLLVIALPVENTKKKNSGTGDTSSYSLTETEIEGENNGSSPSYEADNQMDTYAASMEAKLEEVLEQMAGVGAARVVITVKASQEKVVEKDEPVTRSNTEETDSQGGSRVVSSLDKGESTVFSSQNGSSEPYVVKVIQPEVEGVLVVAQGAGSGDVSKNITEAVEVLFNIDAHKIKVVRMKTK